MGFPEAAELRYFWPAITAAGPLKREGRVARAEGSRYVVSPVSERSPPSRGSGANS